MKTVTPIKCFMLDRTDAAYRWLRRYASGDCPLQADVKPEYRYHCAMVRIEDGSVLAENQPPYEGVTGGERTVYRTEPSEWPHDDPRWPKTCGCGFAFPDDAAWQLFWNAAYRDAAGKLWSIHRSELPGVDRAPAGAMWWADWWPERAPDGGPFLVVRCPRRPDGSGVSDWMPDGPSIQSPAPAWKREGVPPLVTAHPSIFVCPPDGFHGWLRNGELVSC